MAIRKIFIFLIALMFTGGLLTHDLQSGVKEITGIEVTEVDGTTEIEIKSDAPITYTVYKPSDPYSVMVDLHGIGLGKYTEKIVVDRAGVMEIIPSKVEGMPDVTRLAIALTVPAEVKPVQRGNSLILTFVNPEAEEMPVAEMPAPEEGEPAEEEPVLRKAEIIDRIDLSKSDNKLLVIISGDGRLDTKVFKVDDNKLIVDMPGVSTTVEVPKIYEPPVGGIRVGEYPDKTRIVFDLMEPADYEISAEGKEVIISFKVPEAPAVTEEPVEEIAEVSEAEAGPFTTKRYVGEKISIDFQDADLIHVFRLLSEISGYNIVVSPHVKGKFSMKLVDVPWDQALDIILRNYGLSKTVEGNIIRIAPTDVFAREEEEIAKAKEAAEKAGDLVTRVYPINYADVKKIKSAIETAKILTKRGFISVDERTSSVIIKDVETKHAEYEKLIRALDVPTPQVNIDARIVEVTTSFTKELGIQWGLLWKPTPQTEISGTGLATGSGFFSGTPLMINLPAAVGSGSGGSIGFGFISAKDLRALDIQLSAMESSGKGKIISNPRIITMDNQKATIQQGKKIPYQTVSAEGTKTEFVDASLELTVTPHITPEGTIMLDVEAKKNEADFSQTVAGVPTIDTKEAKTRVLVKDGDTLVIGGIFKTNTTKSVATVPGLGDIPLLKWLFRKEQDIENTTELLIFITPRIVR